MATATNSMSITIGTNTAVTGIGNVSVTVTQQPIEVTALGDDYTRHVVGILTAQCDLDFFWDSGIGGHTAILAGIEAGTAINPLTISWAASKSISGKAMVTSWNLTAAPNGVCQVSASLIYTAADNDAASPLSITQ